MAQARTMSPSAPHPAQPVGAPLPEGPSWPTPRRVALGCLLLGAAALSATRFDAVPGVLTTAGMVLAAWSPMMIATERPSTRRLRIAWCAAVALAHLAWWVMWFGTPALPAGLPRLLRWKDGYALLRVSHWPWYGAGDFGALAGLIWPGVAMAALFVSFGAVWRSFHRERRSPAKDSVEQLAVVAGVWLALAGSVGALDAFDRPESVLLLAGHNNPWCDRQRAKPCEHDYDCIFAKCTAGRCAPIPPLQREPPCQNGPSRVAPGAEQQCDFCGDLTSPSLRLAGGSLAVAIALFGAGVAIAATRRLRRRARWIEQVGNGWTEGALDAARRGESDARSLVRAYAVSFLVLAPGLCLACVLDSLWVAAGALTWKAELIADALLVGLPFVVLGARQARSRARPEPKPAPRSEQ